MVALDARLSRDYGEALARAVAAGDGLGNIYGYPQKLARRPRELSEEHSDHSFVNLLKWVRDAISWLIGENDLDQNYVLATSVRSIIGQEEWEEGQLTGAWSLPFSETELSEQYQVRLRGISASVTAQKRLLDTRPIGLWRLRALPPKTSFETL
jgi:hypothetical protein